MNNNTVLSVKALNKSFSGVKVLDDIDLELERGEVHALLGENGAGKSTLVKIICGVYKRDKGRISFCGENVVFASPIEAFRNGISIIYQETSLISQLSILENVFLGQEPEILLPGLIYSKKMLEEYHVICGRLGFEFPPHTIVKNLSIAEQKMVEILKALVRKSSFIIMDEPTDALFDKEVNQLFSIINDLKKDKITILYITHYLDEVFRIADRLTVLRNGKKIITVATKKTKMDDVIYMMVGHEIAAYSGSNSRKKAEGPPIMEVKNLCRGSQLKDISFYVKKGEILGITGLLGAGKTELARSIFGADRIDSGVILLNSVPVKIKSPNRAIKYGICMLPEDRKNQSLFLNFEVFKNISMASIDSYISFGILSEKKEIKITEDLQKILDIKITRPQQVVKYLSGGNQQKIVIGKWIAAEPKVFIMDEPTRGIDVNTKAEVYKIIKKLAEDGRCILFISSEIPEILEVSDRILVMKEGKIAAEFEAGVSPAAIMKIILEGSE